jgi:hypothetical protein
LGGEQQSTDQGKLPVSLDRIKRELDEPPAPLSSRALKVAPVDLPDIAPPSGSEEGKRGTTFRVRVEANRFEFPSFSESLKGAVVDVPPPGGLYHSEVMSLITPPGFRGMEPFTNGEVVQLLATSLATALAIKGGVWAAGKATNWLRLQREAEAREQVQQELEEFKRQTAEGKATAPVKKAP